MGAAMGGGIAALQGKDVLKGALMGGAGGALGGVLMPAAGGLMGGTEGALAGAATSTPATTATAVNAFEAALPGAAEGVIGAGGQAGIGAMAPMGTIQAGTSGLGSLTGMPAVTSVGGAVPGSGMFSGGIGNFLTQNKYALAGGALGGMMAPGEKPPSPEQGNIREFDFNPGEVNPLFGKRAGENYYTADRGFTEGAVTPVEDYDKANGGIIALAEGGAPGIEMQRYARPVRTVDPAVAAYNAQIMERANQQYNVNLRPSPNQVPGSVGYVAPVPRAKKEPTEYTDLINTKKDDDIDEVPQIDYFNHSAVSEAANGGLMSSYSGGGLSSLGNYSDGGQLLRGPGDGVSDSIPARIGSRQPARLADGEFVVPARIVSELGNGSTDAGAKRLYGMMDRVQKNRKKSIGKGKVAVDSKAHRMLPA
jgi:hypothetical protein